MFHPKDAISFNDIFDSDEERGEGDGPLDDSNFTNQKQDFMASSDQDAELMELRSLMRQADLSEMMAGSKTKPLRKCLDQKTLEKLAVPALPKLQVSSDSKAVNRGQKYMRHFSEDYHVQMPAVVDDDMSRLKCIFVQSRVCAALNSRKKLAIVFGLDEEQKVRGVGLDRSGRDRLKIGIDCCLTRGFSPSIPPCMYDLEIEKVVDEADPELNHVYVVLLTINMIAHQMYQLLHGKTFILKEGKVEAMTWDEANQKFRKDMIEHFKSLKSSV